MNSTQSDEESCLSSTTQSSRVPLDGSWPTVSGDSMQERLRKAHEARTNRMLSSNSTQYESFRANSDSNYTHEASQEMVQINTMPSSSMESHEVSNEAQSPPPQMQIVDANFARPNEPQPGILRNLQQQLANNGNSSDEEAQQQRKKRKCEIYMNLFVMFLLATDSHGSCGIPLKEWLLGYFSISIIQQVSQLYLDFIRDAPQYQAYPRFKRIARTCNFVLSEGIVIGWLIYGNTLYYSSDSDGCSGQNATMTYLMLAILILGYLHFLVYIGVFIIIIVVYSARFRAHRQKLAGSVRILRSLVKTKFSAIRDNLAPSLDQGSEFECIICWAPYTETDDIVKLNCNEKHYFHTACIEGWIKGGNNTCPMCREPISREMV